MTEVSTTTVTTKTATYAEPFDDEEPEDLSQTALELFNIRREQNLPTIIVYYRGEKSYFCRAWIKRWLSTHALHRRLSLAHAALFFVSAQSQGKAYSLAEQLKVHDTNTRKSGIYFFGDPHHDLIQKLNDIGSPTPFITGYEGSYRAHGWFYDKGMVQPAVIAVMGEENLYDWVLKPGLTNGGGKLKRQDPWEIWDFIERKLDRVKFDRQRKLVHEKSLQSASSQQHAVESEEKSKDEGKNVVASAVEDTTEATETNVKRAAEPVAGVDTTTTSGAAHAAASTGAPADVMDADGGYLKNEVPLDPSTLTSTDAELLTGSQTSVRDASKMKSVPPRDATATTPGSTEKDDQVAATEQRDVAQLMGDGPADATADTDKPVDVAKDLSVTEPTQVVSDEPKRKDEEVGDTSAAVFEKDSPDVSIEGKEKEGAVQDEGLALRVAEDDALMEDQTEPVLTSAVTAGEDEEELEEAVDESRDETEEQVEEKGPAETTGPDISTAAHEEVSAAEVSGPARTSAGVVIHPVVEESSAKPKSTKRNIAKELEMAEAEEDTPLTTSSTIKDADVTEPRTMAAVEAPEDGMDGEAKTKEVSQPAIPTLGSGDGGEKGEDAYAVEPSTETDVGKTVPIEEKKKSLKFAEKPEIVPGSTREEAGEQLDTEEVIKDEYEDLKDPLAEDYGDAAALGTKEKAVPLTALGTESTGAGEMKRMNDARDAPDATREEARGVYEEYEGYEEVVAEEMVEEETPTTGLQDGDVYMDAENEDAGGMDDHAKTAAVASGISRSDQQIVEEGADVHIVPVTGALSSPLAKESAQEEKAGAVATQAEGQKKTPAVPPGMSEAERQAMEDDMEDDEEDIELGKRSKPGALRSVKDAGRKVAWFWGLEKFLPEHKAEDATEGGAEERAPKVQKPASGGEPAKEGGRKLTRKHTFGAAFNRITGRRSTGDDTAITGSEAKPKSEAVPAEGQVGTPAFGDRAGERGDVERAKQRSSFVGRLSGKLGRSPRVSDATTDSAEGGERITRTSSFSARLSSPGKAILSKLSVSYNDGPKVHRQSFKSTSGTDQAKTPVEEIPEPVSETQEAPPPKADTKAAAQSPGKRSFLRFLPGKTSGSQKDAEKTTGADEKTPDQGDSAEGAEEIQRKDVGGETGINEMDTGGEDTAEIHRKNTLQTLKDGGKKFAWFWGFDTDKKKREATTDDTPVPEKKRKTKNENGSKGRLFQFRRSKTEAPGLTTRDTLVEHSPKRVSRVRSMFGRA